MKKLIRRILKLLGIALLAALAAVIAFRFTWGRPSPFAEYTRLERVDVTWAEAMQDGVITPEEIAVHYAPEIDAAVNVLLSGGGRGDFIAAVDYDGDFITLNNWEHLNDYPLEAVVYYSVQETADCYYVGYYFYHPRDDAEIWLDRHENDMEGIMLAIPRAADAFLPPAWMYTQAHGLLPFYYDTQEPIAEGSRKEGGLLLDGDHPVVYIAPNGTLDSAGHSVESALNHTVYWSVGNSGVRYYHGGYADEPVHFAGPYDAPSNRCSYELRSLEELWALRTGPYGDESAFGQYGAFRGDNWGTDRANPPWGWRNKTVYGYGGSFLSDPAWTFSRAITGLEMSADYTLNPYADWRITFSKAVIPPTQDASACTLHLMRDGWEFSNPAWFTLGPAEDGFHTVTLCGTPRTTLWVAAPAGGAWHMEIRDAEGRVIPGGAVAFTAEYLDN